MKAITYTNYGPPEVLQVEQVDKPVPADDEVLIRVRSAEATKSDVEIRRFKFAVKWFWLPMRVAFGLMKPRRRILGGYFSGEIASIGKDVTQFCVGEQVYGAAGLRFGAYGEYVALPASAPIVVKPANMSFAQAAAVPLGGFNALHFMRLARIKAGERVLINGAGGSIGTHAVQIAKSMGAEVSAVDSAKKEQVLRRMGADHFIDYTRDNFTAMGRTYDVIFDMVAGSDYTACIRTLNAGGRYLSCNPGYPSCFARSSPPASPTRHPDSPSLPRRKRRCTRCEKWSKTERSSQSSTGSTRWSKRSRRIVGSKATIGLAPSSSRSVAVVSIYVRDRPDGGKGPSIGKACWPRAVCNMLGVGDG